MKILIKLSLYLVLFTLSFTANSWVTTQEEILPAYYAIHVYSEPSHTEIAIYENPYTWGNCKPASSCGQQGYRLSYPYFYAPIDVNNDIIWAANYANANGIAWRWGNCGLWANPYPCIL